MKGKIAVVLRGLHSLNSGVVRQTGLTNGRESFIAVGEMAFKPVCT
jgi:hypothetical protein